jgi:hypothetical protein
MPHLAFARPHRATAKYPAKLRLLQGHWTGSDERERESCGERKREEGGIKYEIVGIEYVIEITRVRKK